MADESASGPNDGGRRAFGELEGDVLAVLWSEDHPLTPGEIHDSLGSELAYTTVATVLARLHEKGLVDRAKDGRSHRYWATAGEADVASASFRSVLTRSHDRRALLQGFVQSLSTDDEAVLESLLADARRSRRSRGS